MAGWSDSPALEPYKLDRHLPLNHAWVVVNTTVEDVDIYSASEDCLECPFEVAKSLKANQPTSWVVDTSSRVTWMIMKSKSERATDEMKMKSWLCEMRPTFQEGGIYRLDVGVCEVRPVAPTPWASLPLFISILILMGISTIYTFTKYLYKRRQQQKDVSDGKVLQADNEEEESVSTLYLFRGILILSIIFLTTGAGGYTILTSPIGGITLAECLFYMYVWSIGVNIPTVINKGFSNHKKCHILRDIFVRSFALVFLGTTIDSIVSYQRFSIPLWCPLQKIGLAYLIAASAYVLTVQRYELKSKKIICKAINNLVSLLWCWIISGFLLAIFIILISTFVSFNCMSNTGLEHKRVPFWEPPPEATQNCNNHMTEYANKILVGQSRKTINVNEFFGFTGGVMGILSTIIFMMIGLKSGVVYLQHQSHSDRLKLWSLWGILFGLGAVCFAVATYPLHFNLWPLASVLLIATTSMGVFCLFYVITEIWKFSSYIITSLGIASLAIFCSHLLFSSFLPFRWGIVLDSHVMFLLQSYWIVMLWVVIGIALRRKNVNFEI